MASEGAADEPLISVVLPVYNERDNIATCLRTVAGALAGEPHEILVCYDFDEDSTLEGIELMTDRPTSVRLVKNDLARGVVGAMRAGFAAAGGDVVVTTMADLSDPPDRIAAMAAKVRGGAAVVAGSRYMRGGSQSGGPALKSTLSKWAGLSLRWIAGLGTHDATNNFRAYSRDFLRTMDVQSTGGFEVALELTVRAHLAGLQIDEVASSWQERSAGESRFRLWAWLPQYLRWYLAAMAAPILVGGAWLGATLAQMMASTAGPMTSWAPALIAAGVLFALRRWRGRTALIDGVVPALQLLACYAGQML